MGLDPNAKKLGRDFLRGSLATATFASLPAPSALGAAPLPSAGGPASQPTQDNANRVPVPEALGLRDKFFMPHAVFRELQLGSVRPEGWLRLELTKQANGITGHQPDFCFPFDRRYWDSNERGQDVESRNGGIFWYPWEQMGYWLDGAYRCARLIEDHHLRALAMEPIRYTVEHPVDGWFLGPRRLLALPSNPTDEDPGRWPQAVFFRALAGAAEGENTPDIVAAMSRHYLSDTQCDYQHGPYGPRDRINIESMLWCYAHSGDRRLLDKAEEVWSHVPASDLEALTADRPSDMHGVTFAEVSKLAALLYMYTGDGRQRDVSLAAMRRVFKYHMLSDGTPSTTEKLHETGALNGHETCDIVEFNLSWGYLLMATGAGDFGDRVERALFNAGMGAIRKDWSGFQYISCPNQIHLARNSCQPDHNGTAAALYGPNSDHRPEYPFITACCAGNVARMLPTYVQRMWMSAGDGGPAAAFYGPSRVAAVVGKKQQAVEIVEETTYPFSERIRFRIVSSVPVEFPLHLRIPAWCKRPQLMLNGKPLRLPATENGFVVLERVHAGGDVITLDLPMDLSVGHSSDGGTFVERGPLVYSLRPKEEWTTIAMPEFEITSPDFPMWAAAAASPWNFALAIDEHASLEQQVHVEQTATGADPWSKPPISLAVAARRVSGWDLVRPKGDDANWFKTPPLPAATSRLGADETVHLVPLGSTHLRITVFPTCGSSSRDSNRS
ncbi:MAG: beta-L-arabinofuranosidase domain-containing protein [Terriglobales bacterium]